MNILHTDMAELPLHCLENATFLKQNDYIDLKMMSKGIETSIQFTKVPNFYNVNGKEYYATEMKVKGLKIGTAALAAENVLNVKLHDAEDIRHVRNLNFLFPPHANAKKVTVEVFQNERIFLYAPVTKKCLQTDKRAAV